MANSKESCKNLPKKKAQGIIIDLHSNPGGLLDLAIELSDIFLRPELDIVSVKAEEKNSFEFTNHRTTREKFRCSDSCFIKCRLCKCFEILAGALQDNRRAIMVEINLSEKVQSKTFTIFLTKQELRLPFKILYSEWSFYS